MTHSFLADRELSARHATAYWGALRAAALKRLGIVPDASLPPMALFWPMTVYATSVAPTSRDALTTALAAEAALFDGLLMSRGSAFQSKVGAKAPDLCTYLDASTSLSLCEALSHALQLIAEIWPAARSELDALVRGFTFVETNKRFSSTSDPKIFGLIHIDYSFYQGRSAAELATALLHETGHHALFVATSAAKLIAEPEKKVFSPLRGEDRPAIGVLHAAVALYRMITWGRHLNSETSVEKARIEYDLVPKFRATMKELEAITFLPAGASLKNDLEQLQL